MGISDRIIVMHEGTISEEFLRGEFDHNRVISAAFGKKMEA